MNTATITQKQRLRWASAVQEARRDKGISQEELARLSRKSLSYIQKIENAKKGNETVVNDLLIVISRYRKRERESVA